MSWVLHEGDCLTAMRAMPAASVDCVITDPPYHLTSGKKGGTGGGFMGKAWDGGDIAFDPATWAAVLRVLKPGGHLLAFGGSRTFHRIAVGIEDAGFELRDTVMWIYGSGFPKSLDVSKAIDKAAGATRKVIGKLPNPSSTNNRKTMGRPEHSGSGFQESPDLTVSATDAARQWDGYGTALKPAFEPIIVARKPLIGTVAQNVLAFGVGGINIDGCRVGVNGGTAKGSKPTGEGNGIYGAGLHCEIVPLNKGRWPANVVHDGSDEVLAGFPDADGAVSNGKRLGNGYGNGFGSMAQAQSYADPGTAARFFYCAKASKVDRGAGNTHECVKPQSLMRWLVRLVTPPGGLVLDPFAGSGSTGVAALAEGRRFVGVERDAGYCAIARKRLTAAEQRTMAAPAASLFA